MSNYYKNNVDISLYASKWITNSNAYASFKKAAGNFSVTLDTNYAPTFTSQIDESLTNTTGYKYNGVDIATYMVASFVESSTSNFSSTQIPSWCNKLRVILIGGGAGGGTAQTSYYWGGANWNQQTARVDQHGCHYYDSDQSSGRYSQQTDRYDYDVPYNGNQQAPSQNTTAGGGGGGGGAFIYLPAFDVTSTKSTVEIQVGAGGAGGAAYNRDNGNLDNTQRNRGQAGQATILKISNANYSVAGGGGINNNAWEAGAAGTASGINTGTNNPGQEGQAYINASGGAAGVSGCSDTYSTNTTIRSYGVGGRGSDARQGTGYPAGGNGTNGYYRVYFLTS